MVFWWGRKEHNAALSRHRPSTRLLLGDSVAVAGAKFDTDHECGDGSFGITGRYASKTDSFGVDGVVRLNSNLAMHATYGVTDEKLLGVGLEAGFKALNRENVLDVDYSPANDSAVVNLGVRQGKSRVSASYGFNSVSSGRAQFPASRYELSTKLNELESLKMSYDVTSKASKVKLSRRLDPRNRFEAEYNYDSRARKFVVVTLKHALNDMHSFALGANYGAKKFKAEWDIKTSSGPWTVSSAFGFNAAPIKGEFTVKRRFEM